MSLTNKESKEERFIKFDAEFFFHDSGCESHFISFDFMIIWCEEREDYFIYSLDDTYIDINDDNTYGESVAITAIQEFEIDEI